MSSTVGFQPRPFAVKLPRWLEADKNGVRAHSKQEVTRKGLAGRLWVVHWGKICADSEELDVLYFVTADRDKNKKLGNLPQDLDTTKEFTATLIVTKETTRIEFEQGWWWWRSKAGELTYNGFLALAEGEEPEPTDSYSMAQILQVTAVALVILLGVAYAKTPK